MFHSFIWNVTFTCWVIIICFYVRPPYIIIIIHHRRYYAMLNDSSGLSPLRFDLNFIISQFPVCSISVRIFVSKPKSIREWFDRGSADDETRRGYRLIDHHIRRKPRYFIFYCVVSSSRQVFESGVFFFLFPPLFVHENNRYSYTFHANQL